MSEPLIAVAAKKKVRRHRPITPSAYRLGEANAWKRGNLMSGIRRPCGVGQRRLANEERDWHECQGEDGNAKSDIPYSPAEMPDQRIR